jgi:hypothetical protein
VQERAHFGAQRLDFGRKPDLVELDRRRHG